MTIQIFIVAIMICLAAAFPFFRRFMIAFLIISAILAVHKCSSEDTKAEVRLYCDMVGQGAWPDYKQTFERDCNGR